MYFSQNTNQHLHDMPVRIKCPECGDKISAILNSTPNYGLTEKYRPNYIGLVFMCANADCRAPIFLKYLIISHTTKYGIQINAHPEVMHLNTIEFDDEFIPEEISNDFREALGCYSVSAFNGFGAMCRRTVQSIAADLGQKGKTKVQDQIRELKEMAEVDDETYNILKQIILDGHDGAHPHLPHLSSERAEILLELMKDIMYQLYIRKGKVAKASALRKAKIEEKKSGEG